MNFAKSSEAETLDADAIWLELTFEGQTRTFELGPDETRAIAVGSVLGADLRIDRPGVAPLHFHLERDHDQVWIVPDYGPEGLRVDTVRVTKPRRINSKAVVEFCGLQFEVAVIAGADGPQRRSHAACTRQRGSSPCSPRGPSHAFRERELGATELSETFVSAALAGAPTVELDRVAFHARAQLEQATVRLLPVTRAVENVEPTVVIRPCPVVAMGAAPENEPVQKPEPLINESEPQQTTLFEPMRISQAPFGRRSHEVLRNTIAVVESASVLKPQLILQWLSQLGSLTRRRPLLVWVTGTLAVFALSAMIARILAHPTRAVHAQGRSSVIDQRVVPSTAPSGATISSFAQLRVGLEIVPATPAFATAKLKKGQPGRHDLAAAVDALASGHYVEARAAYARLAAEPWNDPVLHQAIALLTKKLSAECSSRTQIAIASCPEVKH